MRIYVAASSAELHRARTTMRAVVELGHALAHDWVALVDEFGANPKAAARERQGWANGCLSAVRSSDLLWVLSPADGQSLGVGAELGYAYARGIPIIASGPGTELTVFTSLARAFATDVMALEWIASKGQWRGRPPGQWPPPHPLPPSP